MGHKLSFILLDVFIILCCVCVCLLSFDSGLKQDQSALKVKSLWIFESCPHLYIFHNSTIVKNIVKFVMIVELLFLYCFFVSSKDLKLVLVGMMIVSGQGFWRGSTWDIYSTSCWLGGRVF